MSTRHLDNEYRNRWEEYHLIDGSVKDSREINWRDIEWEKVQKIIVHLRKQTYNFSLPDDHLFFMRFRWGGSKVVYDDEGAFIERTPIHIWTVGSTDGSECTLTDIDFFTGKVVNNYVMTLQELTTHIHPNVMSDELCLG